MTHGVDDWLEAAYESLSDVEDNSEFWDDDIDDDEDEEDDDES
jgi:hypothetical protein